MKRLSLFICVIIGLSSCSNYQKISFSGEAQGTYYAITYYDRDGKDLQTSIDSLLDDFDMTASVWQKNSIISAINRNDSNVKLNQDFITIFKKAQSVANATDGAFDITVGPLINAWGFWFRDRIDVDQKVLDSLMPLIGYKKVKLEGKQIVKEYPAIKFDFNAIAQGYSVDLVAKYLESRGISRYLIDIGGEVYAHGRKPGGVQWKVGIEKPTEDVLGKRILEAVVFLKDKALATSGSYRKFHVVDGVKYSHTVDPKTGYPVQHSLLSASVLADDCITADAFATAFMVMGLEKTREFLLQHNDLKVFLIYAEKDGSLNTWYSKGMRKLMYQ